MEVGAWSFHKSFRCAQCRRRATATLLTVTTELCMGWVSQLTKWTHRQPWVIDMSLCYATACGWLTVERSGRPTYHKLHLTEMKWNWIYCCSFWVRVLFCFMLFIHGSPERWHADGSLRSIKRQVHLRPDVVWSRMQMCVVEMHE